MKNEEQKAILNQILTTTEQGEKSKLLLQLEQDYVAMNKNIDTLTENNNKLAEENKKLLSVNSDLFMQVGVQTKQEQEHIENNNDNNNNEPPTKMEYGDLEF